MLTKTTLLNWLDLTDRSVCILPRCRPSAYQFHSTRPRNFALSRRHASAMPAVHKQKIPARYVKVDVLKNLLIEWYGNGNFEFEVV